MESRSTGKIGKVLLGFGGQWSGLLRRRASIVMKDQLIGGIEVVTREIGKGKKPGFKKPIKKLIGKSWGRSIAIPRHPNTQGREVSKNAAHLHR